MTLPEGHDRAAKRQLGDARTISYALRAFVPGSWIARMMTLTGLVCEGFTPLDIIPDMEY